MGETYHPLCQTTAAEQHHSVP